MKQLKVFTGTAGQLACMVAFDGGTIILSASTRCSALVASVIFICTPFINTEWNR